MRTLPAPLAAHLAGAVLTLATCWRVARRDGLVLRFTDHDRDLSVAGETYLARTGYARAAVGSGSDMGVDETEITGVLDSEEITERDINGGLWDYAAVRIFLVNWANPAAGVVRLRRGRIGEVRKDERGRFLAELRGLAQALQQRVGEVYQPDCRAELGDRRCRLPLEPPMIARSAVYPLDAFVRVPIGAAGTRADDGGVIWKCTTAGTTAAAAPDYVAIGGQVVADGTAAFTAEDAWTVYGEVAAGGDGFTGLVVAPGFLGQPRQATAAYFELGTLTFETGANAGISREILFWDPAASALSFFLAFPYPIAVGDGFRLAPGCDRQAETCRVTFGNFLNFRGEPDVPGQDALMRVGMSA